MPASTALELVARGKQTVADGVVLLTLARPDGASLPAWAPGAHVDVRLGAVVRQYSLCSSPADLGHYQVAVLRAPGGRGGSAYVHDVLAPGDTLAVSTPRNNFALVDAKRYLFIAGGIGVTPILPMIEAADRTGADWRLLYGGRTRASMAFRAELARRSDRVALRPEDEYGLLDLAGTLAATAADAVVYCCGPEPLLQAVQRECARHPVGPLHVERFAAVEREAGVDDVEFDVQFVQSGVTVTVPPGRSIVEVAEEAGVPVVYSCEEGTCGSCETVVLGGEPDHRDSLLTDQERRDRACMLICVSRATGRLVLDA